LTDWADRFTAVLDTCVLVDVMRRNIILSLAEGGQFRPRWSSTTINTEFLYALPRAVPHMSPAQSKLQQQRIVEAFPEAEVGPSAALEATLPLLDVKDRHVLAAAIGSKAAVIVTENLKDFPTAVLAPFEVEALSSDDFIADALDLSGPEAVACLRRMRLRFNRPEMDADALITSIEGRGLTETATILTKFRALL
jgi:hypothetical protein